MSQIGKRGIAKCENSDKSNPNHTFTIEFNERGIPVGDNEPRFTSWFGCECKTRLPCYLEMKKMDKKLFEQLWLYTKAKSEKSKISARQNKDPARLGRTTFANLTHNNKWKPKWEQLVAQNPVLGSIKNLHSKLWIVSRSQKNIESGIHEIASDIKGRLDALVQKERERDA